MTRTIVLLVFAAGLFFPPTASTQSETRDVSSEVQGNTHDQFSHWHRCPEQIHAQGFAPERAPSLESVQIETSDLRLYERFFERFLGAHLMFSMDHPLVDQIRTYCYHRLLITIRKDLKTPRPTGWIQVNFLVDDLATIEQELKEAGHRLASSEPGISGEPYLIRVKRGVPRNLCRVDRLELIGPEGFLIGFNQIHKETCRPPLSDPISSNGSHTTHRE